MISKKSRIKTVISLCALSLSVMPQQPAGDLASIFSRPAVEESVARVQRAADDYIRLSEMILENSNLKSDFGLTSLNLASLPEKAEVKIRLKGSDLKKLQSFSWEMQEIGLRNAIRSIGGYIEYQELEKKRLKMELLLAKKAPKSQIDKLAAEIKRSEGTLIEKYAGEGGWAD